MRHIGRAVVVAFYLTGASPAGADPVATLAELTTQRLHEISVQEKDGTETAGAFVMASDQVLVIRDAAGDRRVPAENIQLVWALEHATEKGAIGGLVIGGLLGGLSIINRDCSDCVRNQAQAAAIWVTGGVVGGWFGHRHVRRRIVFAAKNSMPSK